MRADVQTAGRGRRARAWSSPAGNLHASVLVTATERPRQELSFVAALALHDALSALFPPPRPLAIQIKWPNDVLLDGAKVAGILLEAAGAALVIGFGVNLAHYPPDAGYRATSLAARGVTVTPAAFAARLAAAFAARRAQWVAGGFAGIRADWLARAAFREGAIEARLPGETVVGVMAGLEADGALALRLPDGSLRRIYAADIFGV